MRFIKILAILIFSTQLFAQESDGKWEAVYNEGTDRVFIDISGVSNFYGDDIYVWSLTEHSTPLELESIPDKIYRTNTYYLFNTRIRKYSILYIIYYDENKNVLASYDYGRNTKVEVYQYNYPLMKNSLEERIFDRCVEAREEAHKK